jgi:hypothetical protein
MEKEIVAQTNAISIDVPEYGKTALKNRIAHGTRLDLFRDVIPKKKFKVDADVIWYILMGPENYELDLFEKWDLKAKYRIVYIFDTLEPQFKLIKKLFTNSRFNICITSFAEAVPHLESITGIRWHSIEQAIPAALFSPVPLEEKLIDFSSYGRRLNNFHEGVKEFCFQNNLYYDYSAIRNGQLTASNEELYRHYAWHMTHSVFTISWPVELTNSMRAGRLNPITCRWFEAASAGTVILGKKPANSSFDDVLAKDLVIECDPNSDKHTIWKHLDKLYSDRNILLQRAEQIRQHNHDRWTWADRIKRIINLMEPKEVY